MPATFAPPTIRPSPATGGRIWRFDTLPSTSGWARENIARLRPGDVVATRHQTAGRGRFDRRWFSAPGDSLALSLVLDGAALSGVAPNLAQAAALGVRRALARAGLAAMLHWPNDVLVNGRKIAGLLAESIDGGRRIVLGIGLNVNIPAATLAAAIPDRPATSMALEAGRRFEPEAVQSEILEKVTQAILELQAGSFAALAAEWAAHDGLCGQRLRLSLHETQAVEGRYAGLDRLGRLCLTDARGQCTAYWAGEVQKLLDGSGASGPMADGGTASRPA